MKILLTGGAGFMGSNMIHYLLRSYPDSEVVNFDKLTYAGNLENLRDVEQDPRYRFVKADIADAAVVDAVMKEKPDVVLNYAAETHVDRSIMDPGAFVRTDVIGTYTLLEAVRKHNIPKYIQISTDEVYGSLEDGEWDESAAFDPSSPYSASKAGADHLVHAYFKTYGTPTLVTHSCNFMGPYQYPEKIIPLFITNLLEDKKIPLYGTGQNVREWIYTEDHCAAIDLLMRKGENGGKYHIGTGERLTNNELTRKILMAMGKSEEMIEYVKDRPGHDLRYALNSAKMRHLGWAPEHDFQTALEKTVAWYREHEPWWKRIKSGEYLEYYKQQYQT